MDRSKEDDEGVRVIFFSGDTTLVRLTLRMMERSCFWARMWDISCRGKRKKKRRRWRRKAVGQNLERKSREKERREREEK